MVKKEGVGVGMKYSDLLFVFGFVLLDLVFWICIWNLYQIKIEIGYILVLVGIGLHFLFGSYYLRTKEK